MNDLKLKVIKKDDYNDGSYYIELDVDFINSKESKEYLKKRFEHLRITRNSDGELNIESLPF